MDNYYVNVYRCYRGVLHCYSYQEAKPSRRMSPGRPATVATTLDSQRVRDRERELERIHRRSRELMLTTPPNAAANGDDHYGSHHHHRASRENSVDRISTTSAASSKASSTTHIRRGPRYIQQRSCQANFVHFPSWTFAF